MRLQEAIAQALLAGPRTAVALAEEVGADPTNVWKALRRMKDKGAVVPTSGSHFKLTGRPLEHGHTKLNVRTTAPSKVPTIYPLAMMLAQL
jgi:DNA-binding IclR family transcriptional regulator